MWNYEWIEQVIVCAYITCSYLYVCMLSAVASLPLLIPRICGLILVHYCSCSNCLADMCHVYADCRLSASCFFGNCNLCNLRTVSGTIVFMTGLQQCNAFTVSWFVQELLRVVVGQWFIELCQWSTCLLGVNLACISFHERLYHAVVYYILYYIQQCMYQHDNSTYHYSVTVHKQMHELCHRSLDQSSSPFGCCVKWRRL